MKKLIEQELKYKIENEEIADELFNCFLVDSSAVEPPEVFKMNAKYYDDENSSLLKNQIAFRIRRENSDYVATLKSRGDRQGAMHIREEKEKPVDESANPNDVFLSLCGETFPLAGQMKALFETDYVRTQQKLSAGGCSFFICTDIGLIKAGDKSVPVCELEIEYIDGEIDGMYNFGAALKDAFSLSTEPQSKFQRGISLL